MHIDALTATPNPANPPNPGPPRRDPGTYARAHVEHFTPYADAPNPCSRGEAGDVIRAYARTTGQDLLTVTCRLADAYLAEHGIDLPQDVRRDRATQYATDYPASITN